jgi:hypothetical protein
VHPLALRAMDEIGIDLRGQSAKTIDRFLGDTWDYVITVCDHAAESCPVVPVSATRLHWSFDDPSAAAGSEAQRLATFRRVRDAMKARIYEKFFGAAPVKVKPGYVKFLPAFGPLNLALSQATGAGAVTSTIWASRSSPPRSSCASWRA